MCSLLPLPGYEVLFMNEKKRFPCEAAMVLGLVINSFAVSLMVRSGLGISTLSSVPLSLSELFPILSFGVWNFLIQSLTILVLVLATRVFRWGYLLSFAIAGVFGLLIDGWAVLLSPLPLTLPLRALYFFIGFVVISFGASLFIKCRLPVLPFDTFVRDFSQHFKKPVRVVKTAFDFFCLTVSLIISLILGRLVGVGVGTVFSACFTGLLTQRMVEWLEARFVFQPAVPLVRRFVPPLPEEDTGRRSA